MAVAHEKPAPPPAENTNFDEPPGSPPLSSPNGAYSAFTQTQKRLILGFASYAGWLSSVSSFIHFPAIPAIATDLGVSVEKINLTVTSYLITAGLFSAITGNACGRFGRQVVFIACLAVHFGVNLGLALQRVSEGCLC